MNRRRWLAVEDVEVLDGLVDLAVLEVADAVPVVAFQQHADERVKEVQVLGRRLQREGVDRDAVLPQADFEIAPAEERRQLSIAVPDVENHGLRRVLLRVRDEEVQQKALAASGRAENERVTDVLHVQVEGVRRPVRRLEHGQRLPPQMGAHRLAVIEREQEAQIGEIRFEQREPPEIVRAVAGDDGQPGVEQVVGLFEETPVVDGHRLHGLGRLVLNRSRVGPVQDERQRALAEEVAVHLQLRQRVTELPDRRVRRVVDQHLLRPRLRRDVVHDRHALVEEVPAAALDISTHPVARNSLPFEAGDELARNLVQVLQQERERLARRLLHREHLDDAVADQQVVSVAVDGGIRDEVVQVRVVREPRGVHHGRVVVHELAKEAERLGLLQARRDRSR